MDAHIEGSKLDFDKVMEVMGNHARFIRHQNEKTAWKARTIIQKHARPYWKLQAAKIASATIDDRTTKACQYLADLRKGWEERYDEMHTVKYYAERGCIFTMQIQDAMQIQVNAYAQADGLIHTLATWL